MKVKAVRLTDFISIDKRPKFKRVSERPATGQFIAIWSYKRIPWCNTYKWEGNKLFQYHEHDDKWYIVEDKEFLGFVPENIKLNFIIITPKR